MSTTIYRFGSATFLAICSLALLAACGQEEPAATSDPAPVAEETSVETVEEATESLADVAEETLEVVEESAAEPEDTGETPIVLAQADTAPPPISSEFREGQHYTRLVPSQPTIGGADKIEVAEFFWYGCPHCYDLEPTINRWEENKPANVRFVRVPAMWNDVLKLHAQLYYTEKFWFATARLRTPLVSATQCSWSITSAAIACFRKRPSSACLRVTTSAKLTSNAPGARSKFNQSMRVAE